MLGLLCYNVAESEGYKMKKVFKFFMVFAACFSLFFLASCSNVTQKYADKINEEAQDGDGEYITLDQVRNDLGDEAVEILILNSGVVIAVKGCKSVDDIKAKLDAGEDVEGLVITIVAGNATSATYRKITSSDLKK